MKGWNTRDTRKMITPIESRDTKCPWEGEHYGELGGAAPLTTATYTGINLLNNFNAQPVNFFQSPYFGNNFYEIQGNEIEVCHLHFKGYIWNNDAGILPTITGSTCRTIILWDNQPYDTGVYEPFAQIFQSQRVGLLPITPTRWNSPIKFSQRGRYELLYDSWVRVPPHHIGEIPPPGPSQDSFTYESTNGRLSMDFVLDMEGREIVFSRIGGIGSNATEPESGVPILFCVSDDPNISLNSTWSLTFSCEMYWNNKKK